MYKNNANDENMNNVRCDRSRFILFEILFVIKDLRLHFSLVTRRNTTRIRKIFCIQNILFVNTIPT